MSGDIDIIVDIEQRIAKAWVNGDRNAIEAILAPEWSVTDPSGNVLTREQVLHETFDSTDRTIESMIVDDVRVKLFRETAIATGRTRATGSYRGAHMTVALRFTDVFVRHGERWRVVASHGSLIAS